MKELHQLRMVDSVHSIEDLVNISRRPSGPATADPFPFQKHIPDPPPYDTLWRIDDRSQKDQISPQDVPTSGQDVTKGWHSTSHSFSCQTDLICLVSCPEHQDIKKLAAGLTSLNTAAGSAAAMAEALCMKMHTLMSGIFASPKQRCQWYGSTVLQSLTPCIAFHSFLCG